MATNRSMKSGLALSSSENSSTTMNNDGSGSSGSPDARARSYSLMRGVVAAGAQQLLAPHHLAAQRVLHAVDQHELVLEVGDHRRHVRHRRHAGERRAALEVDEHQVELLGGVGEHLPEHERPQELGLAGARGADDQAVRPHALLRRLLDVELHGRAVGAEADRHAQPVARRPRTPGEVDVEVADVGQPQQVEQLGVALRRRCWRRTPAPQVSSPACSGVRRRASASALARSSWSAKPAAGSALTRSARTGTRPSSRGPRRGRAAAPARPPARPSRRAGRAPSRRARPRR